jgi:hypothetical protein
LFKAQQISQAVLSDTASENAARQFNATSTNQVNQFNASLATQVSQFNTTQSNAIKQFNVSESDALAKFNADVKNQRDQFNATQRLVIDQSNAQWLRDVSTVNTAATNAANLANAQLANALTVAEYNNEVQLYRDNMTFAWQAGQNDAQRAVSIAQSTIQAQSGVNVENAKSTNSLLTAAAAAAFKFIFL